MIYKKHKHNEATFYTIHIDKFIIFYFFLKICIVISIDLINLQTAHLN